MSRNATVLRRAGVIGEPVFLTWRLRGSLPPGRWLSARHRMSASAFDRLDLLLGEALTGPLHLRQPLRAEMAAQAIRYNAWILAHYELCAFVVMGNHLHLLIRPRVSLSRLTRCLKGVIARRAREMFGFAETPFWELDSHEQRVRTRREFERIRAYIEEDPVRAGFVRAAADFRWSSAWETPERYRPAR